MSKIRISKQGYRSQPTIGVLAGWNVYGGNLDSYLDPVLRGIQAAAAQQGCNLLLACGMSTQSTIQPAWPEWRPDVDFLPVGPWNTDGLIAILPLAGLWQTSYFQDLAARGFPIVYAGAGLPGSAVVADNETGIHEALHHLAQHGHRRIAFIGGIPGNTHGDSHRRYEAYQTGLAALGLSLDPNLVAWGYHQTPGGEAAMARILETGRPFTAVLASNDSSASGAMNILRAAGLRIPDDVAIVGFDDRLEAEAETPPLTTVRYPTFELGHRALTLLHARIQGESTGNPRLKVPAQLVIRQSCGCPAGTLSQDATGLRPKLTTPADLIQQMGQVVRNETHNLSFDEITALCESLIAACPWVTPTDVAHGPAEPAAFLASLHDILEEVIARGGNSNAWQNAITLLRNAALETHGDDARQLSGAEEAWHQARLAISRAAQSQATRSAIRTADISSSLGEMVAGFFGADNEAEIYRVLDEHLPAMAIRQVTLALYEGQGDDPAAMSILRPLGPAGAGTRFPTRSFPPPGMYDADAPLSLTLLPLSGGEEISGFIAFQGGEPAAYAWVARQVTAALREVRLYRQALEGRQLAEEANRMKSRFLSVVSHELRTPVNLITGLSDLLLNQSTQGGDQDIAAMREDVERIYTTAQHLDGLIRDVLDLASSEVNQLKLAPEPLDMVKVLDQTAAIGEQLARAKGLLWRAEIPRNLPPVWGDRTRLRQVVINLVNNAVKFTSYGEITLHAAAENGSLSVVVQDTGLGIPPEDQLLIFDEFRQSERTVGRGCGGLGLGLAICKRLVEGHGGHIGVQSSGEENGGSTFYFSLPTLDQGEASDIPRELPGWEEIAACNERRTLIIVKNEVAGRRLQSRLAAEGFQVALCLAHDLEARLQAIVASPPEMILLDEGVTADRGWELLKLLKGNPATAATTVLFFSFAEDGACARGNVLDIDYMAKPMGTAALAEALARRGLLPDEAAPESKKRILIVDDDLAMLAMHTSVVSTQFPSYQILKADNGRAALEIIGTMSPDLVLLDLMMPEIDGFGVLEAMRDTDIGREIPVVVLTGKSLTDEDMQRLNHGTASVLAKGILSADETLAHIEAALACTLRPGSEARRIVLKALVYIHARYAENISRESIAQHVSVSSRHLNRCFRQELGISPVTYLNRYRIKQAKALLQRGEHSITTIGLEVGFSSSGYFTRIFKQELGLSPRDYQQGKRTP
jgi:signal transduction histidine kinase/DNA-binding LacI/PurR family transcriptional regulator/AraC-like DNA-binding protein/response regulator of citrate/malate metabolism